MKSTRTVFLEDLMAIIAKINELEYAKKYTSSIGKTFTEADEIELCRLKSFEIFIPQEQEIPALAE